MINAVKKKGLLPRTSKMSHETRIPALRLFFLCLSLLLIVYGCISLFEICTSTSELTSPAQEAYDRTLLPGLLLLATIYAGIAFINAPAQKFILSLMLSAFLFIGMFESLFVLKPELFIYNKSISNYFNVLKNPRVVRRLISEEQIQEVAGKLVMEGMFFRNQPNVSKKMVDPIDKEEFHVQYDEIGYRNIPGTHTSNSHIPYVFLGDSGTDGANAKLSFPQVVSNLTSEPTLNLGFRAYGPQYYLESLKRFGLEKKPKIIFIAIGLDDIVNARTYHRIEAAGLNNGIFYLLRFEPGLYRWSNEWRYILPNHFKLLRYIIAVLRHPPEFKKNTEINPNIKPTSEPITSFLLNEGKNHIEFKGALFQHLSPPKQEWKHFEDTLIEIKELADSIQARVVLVPIPYPSKVYYPYLNKGKDDFLKKYNTKGIDFGIIPKTKAMAQKLNLEFFDPTAPLREAAQTGPFLYKDLNNSHFSSFGTESMGKILVSRMIQPNQD